MKIQIVPSLLSADFGNLNQEIASVDLFSDRIHLDVMDGHFVPNITFGPPMVRMLRSRKPFECHLMIEHPEKFVEAFVQAGASFVIIHQEVCPDLLALISQIRGLGAKVGVALNPETSLSSIFDVLDAVDMVLLMTVHPGFGGQGFVHSVLPKIRELRALRQDLDIEVDGGINHTTAPLVKEAGANVLVSGSYIFGLKNREKAIKSLRNL